MIDVEIINVFSGDNVNLFIPVSIQGMQFGKLTFLFFGKIRKVIVYNGNVLQWMRIGPDDF